MKFVLRDDDTCYWTRPNELQSALGHIWDIAPVSLACVPNIRGPVPGTKNAADHDDGTLRPISDNGELVRFISEQTDRGTISVMLHGWSHEDIDGEPEYVGAKDLDRRTAEGKRLLVETFGGEILTFVPPHNSIGRSGANAVVSEGMNIFHAYSHRPLERNLDRANLMNFARTLLSYIRYGKKRRWPRPYKFNSHLELGSYLLNRYSDLDEMRRSIDFVNDHDGVFCLATHYWEINRDGLHNQLGEIIGYANRIPGTEFVTDVTLWQRLSRVQQPVKT